MGFLRRAITAIGDVAKGAINAVPGIGGVTKVVFGEVGSGGLVGRVGGSGGGGLTQAAQTGQSIQQVMQSQPIAPRPSQVTPPVPDFGNFGPINGNGSALTTTSNGSYMSSIPQLLGSNQIVMEPQQKIVNSAPPGWVIVTMPNGQKKAVLKDIARCLGLWKPRKKPPISAGDWNKLKTANRVRNKAKKVAETADFVCRKSKR